MIFTLTSDHNSQPFSSENQTNIEDANNDTDLIEEDIFEERMEEEEDDMEEETGEDHMEEEEVQNNNESNEKIPINVQLIHKAQCPHSRQTYTNHSRTILFLKKHKIWQHLSDPKLGVPLSQIADMLKIDRSTLRYWRKKLLTDPSWSPSHIKDSWKSYVFTPKQESHLVELLQGISENDLPITNNLFRRLATEYYQGLPDKVHPQPYLNFNCSNRFISKFRLRHNLSRRRGHSKRRPDISPEVINEFRTDAEQLFQDVNPDHIANCDETFWHVVNITPYTWLFWLQF